MINIIVTVTEDGTTVYGGAIETEDREDSKQLVDEVREALAEILMKYSNREEHSNSII